MARRSTSTATITFFFIYLYNFSNQILSSFLLSLLNPI